MDLEIIMSTMAKNKISDLKLFERNINSLIIIVNQVDNCEINNYFLEDNAIGARMFTYNERGSSKSRNRGLELANGDICFIADDDIKYVENYKNVILNKFNDNKNIDIITFQVKTPDEKLFKNNYMKKERLHSKYTVMKCSSVEIAFKRESIINAGLIFDEEFGLGSKYRIHDDVIFLSDAIKKGLKVLYVPIPLVIHPAEVSGRDYNEHLIFSKGAAFVRMFGVFGIVINIVFSIRKYNEYKSKYSFWKFNKIAFSGSMEFINANKTNKVGAK